MIQLGVIGHPIAHSKSPAMHKAALSAAGIQGDYTAFDIAPGALNDWVADHRSGRLRGFNVTVPHKRAIADHCDRLDESAEAVGAVNTVLIQQDGAWVGFNTDVLGFSHDLRETAGVDPATAVALVVGAGGAASAVAVALLQAGARRVVVSNRTEAHAQALATSLGIQACAFRSDSLRAVQPDVVINATSCGLGVSPSDDGWDESVGFFEQLPVGDWDHPTAYDLIYTPRKTAFRTCFEQAGCATHHGLGMLVRQGAMAFQLWTGVPLSRITSVMEDAADS